MNLREIRIKKGYTQKNVADFLHCSAVVYSRYETGDRQPSIEILMKLSEFFGVTIDYLVGKEEIAFPGLSPYELSLVTASRNADERARQDALTLLTAHKVAIQNHDGKKMKP